MKFVERTSENGRTKIVFPYGALYYYSMWAFFALGAAYFAELVPIPIWVVFIALVLMIALAIPYWSTMRELKRVMKQGTLRASGSKYSFSNPLTYEWDSEG